MRVLEKIDLIDRIGRALQARFGFTDIDVFLGEFGVLAPQNADRTSKWSYTKAALAGKPDDLVANIAEELDLVAVSNGRRLKVLPENWKNSAKFRVFISHISQNSAKATRLRDCLEPYAISGFVAHEDIQPTQEWQAEVERALQSMDAFIAIHTPGFSKSFWTQQEVGFALGRGTKVISFKMGEDPSGFTSKHQALARRDRSAEQVAAEIDALLTADLLTASKLATAKKTNGMSLEDEIPF